MAKKTKEFEDKKTNAFHVLLQVIMGLVLVWCVLWFIPVESLFNFMGDVFGKAPNNLGVTAALTLIIVLAVLVFAFGYYLISWCLSLGNSKEENSKIEKATKKETESKETV